jgi:dTDP-4-amino-4,6-dideoxygalactose transaminase
MAHLTQAGVSSAMHYQPLHLSEMGRRFGGGRGDCPVAEDVSNRLLRLPFHRTLSEADLDRVTAAVMGW